MYRCCNQPPVGLSGLWDSITSAFKGIKITAPPINLPSYPTTVQIPGTTAPSQPQPQPYGASQWQQPGGTPGWVMPVVLGGAGLLAVMMLTQRGRR